MKKNCINFLLGCVAVFGTSDLNAQILYSESFNSNLGTTSASGGFNANWVWTNSCSESGSSGHSAPGSALFQGSGCTFGNGSNQVIGDLTTPTISIPAIGAKLTFNYFHTAECQNPGSTCFYDVLKLQISNNGGTSWTDIMSTDGSPSGLVMTSTWTPVSYTLSSYAGQTIMVRFNFDSQDGVSNSFDGVYVDDIVVEGFQPCAGTPSANAVVTPTSPVCANEAVAIGLQQPNNPPGTVYQWYSSTTSPFGPFTVVPSANGSGYTAPNHSNDTWYVAVITCTFSSQSVTATVGQVSVMPTVIDTVPYYEGFEGVTKPNRLPNCSWYAPNLGTRELVYLTSNTLGRFPRTGSHFASFYYSPQGQNHYYTNGIWLDANVTYSATVWWQTEYYGYNNWTDLSILLGPNQNATGQQTVASTNGPAVSNVYHPLTNTFVVNNSGLYYVDVRGTSTSGSAQYLTWDDLSIIIPCEYNEPALTVSPDQTVCAQSPVLINASGADTYLWSNGATDQFLNMPLSSTTVFTVTGTSTLTGCSASRVHMVTVNPKPDVGIFANKLAICEGESVILTAFGADMYNWTDNTITQVNIVSPSSTSVFSVTGTNLYGCQTSVGHTVVVNDNPQLTVGATRSVICIGEQAELQGQGAIMFTWVSNSSYNQGSPVFVSPKVPTSFSVTGTDANGCKSTEVVFVDVQECLGLDAQQVAGMKVFPNPNSGVFTVQAEGMTSVTVSDVTGRNVGEYSGKTSLEIDARHLAAGVYYLTISTELAQDVVRIIKH